MFCRLRSRQVGLQRTLCDKFDRSYAGRSCMKGCG